MTDQSYNEARIRSLENTAQELKETLRDRFAMAAMGAIGDVWIDMPFENAEYAEACYAMADAMMTARVPK